MGCPVPWGQRPGRRVVAVWVRLAWVRVQVWLCAVCECVQTRLTVRVRTLTR